MNLNTISLPWKAIPTNKQTNKLPSLTDCYCGPTPTMAWPLCNECLTFNFLQKKLSPKNKEGFFSPFFKSWQISWKKEKKRRKKTTLFFFFFSSKGLIRSSLKS
jgi:hypothetical protein